MKKIQKPFSIEAWKNGAKVETIDGRSVRILCTDIKTFKPIVAAIMDKDGEEDVMSYNINGSYYKSSETDCDLVIVEEVEEPERWAECKYADGEGYFINNDSEIEWDKGKLNDSLNFRLFASEKQAKSALAMARISQIMAHDERYGGVVTDEEWRDDEFKYTINRYMDKIVYNELCHSHDFLAFHTAEQRDLFFAENERLVKDYLMID